jgi:upstream activation factor subunit UAF30
LKGTPRWWALVFEKRGVKMAEAKKMDALQKPLTPSPELAVIVGSGMLPRGQVVSKVWEYIKKHNLQKPTDKRMIVADANLKKVFGVDECSMFEMNKHLARHLK